MSVPPRMRRPARAGTAPVDVLLLHGMGGGVNGWDPLDPLLDDRFRLWDVPLPWSPTGDVRWAFERDVTGWVADAVDAAERAAGNRIGLVVAHSFAANVLLELAEREGPRWRRPTVLVSPFYRPDPAAFEWTAIAEYADGFRRMLDEGLRLRAGTRISDETRTDMAIRLRDLMGPYTWLRFFDTFLRTALLRPARLEAPVLVIGGADDAGARAQGLLDLAAALPAARVEILAGCGHFPMIERPDRLAGAINDFATTAAAAHRPAPASHHLQETPI
ncbi:alpha/beta hydrolase [Streptomyces sp. NPDC048191]|uniref:alpha/beta fold hydrolase n=1 Tax=Streptomyces sp. NPDC048191 TaxID=3155484 RepID=UPI0033DE8DB6